MPGALPAAVQAGAQPERASIARVKALLRIAGERTVEGLRRLLGRLLDELTPEEWQSPNVKSGDLLPGQRCGVRGGRDPNRVFAAAGRVQVVEPGDELLDEGQAELVVARRRGRLHRHPARDGLPRRDRPRQ